MITFILTYAAIPRGFLFYFEWQEGPASYTDVVRMFSMCELVSHRDVMS
jgi:hypothetical protein